MAGYNAAAAAAGWFAEAMVCAVSGGICPFPAYICVLQAMTQGGAARRRTVSLLTRFLRLHWQWREQGALWLCGFETPGEGSMRASGWATGGMAAQAAHESLSTRIIAARRRGAGRFAAVAASVAACSAVKIPMSHVAAAAGAAAGAGVGYNCSSCPSSPPERGKLTQQDSVSHSTS